MDKYFQVTLPDWHSFGTDGVALALAFVFLLVGKYVYGIFRPFGVDQQLGDKDNKAVALSLGGFVFALGLVIAPLLAHESGKDLQTDLIDLAIWVVIALVLLVVGQFVNDKVIFGRFSNSKELAEDHNAGLGIAEAGSFVAVALILSAALSGEEGSLSADIIGALIFFVAGQIALILVFMIDRKFAGYDLLSEIEKDNPAAGLLCGAKAIAIANVMAGAIHADDSLVFFAVWAVIGCVLLFIGQRIVDGLIFPNHQLSKEISEDRNWGIAAVVGLVLIMMSQFIKAAFL